VGGDLWQEEQDTADDLSAEANLWDMIEGIRVVMLTTKRGDKLDSRPMHAYLDPEQRCLWFIAPFDSEMAHEIEDGEAANPAFVDRDD